VGEGHDGHAEVDAVVGGCGWVELGEGSVGCTGGGSEGPVGRLEFGWRAGRDARRIDAFDEGFGGGGGQTGRDSGEDAFDEGSIFRAGSRRVGLGQLAVEKAFDDDLGDAHGQFPYAV